MCRFNLQVTLARHADNTAAMDPILIITRPAPAGEAFAASVLAAFAAPLEVIHAPAMRIVPMTFALPETRDVIFTSARGVAQAPPGHGMTAWCVGRATAAAAQAKGYVSRVADGDADALVSLILSQRQRGPLVHIAGRHRRGDVAPRLTAAGLRCTTVEAYDQIPLDPPPALAAAAGGDAPLVAPVFSPNSARGVLGLTRGAPLHVIAMSGAVARLFDAMTPASLLTVGHPDADHMRDMTVAVLRGLAGAGE